MHIFLRVVFFFVLLLLGIFLGEFIFRYVYMVLPENGISFGWWGSNADWSLFFGAIFAFYFFLSLLITALLNKYKYYLLIINIIILLPTLWLFASDWWFDGTLIILSVIGWLIGEGILKLYSFIKKN